MTRNEKLLSGVELAHARGIEIGPLTSPIVSKEGSDVRYVDCTDQAGLRHRYAGDPSVDIANIVPVDAVWGERTLRECFADEPLFDYVVASHVIEHVPDMIGWLQEIAEVLRPGGLLCLAIPDKRYTFDYLRQPTRLCELIDAWLRRNRRPMPAQLFDFNVNAVEVDLVAAWDGTLNVDALKHYVNEQFALDRSVESVRDGKYVDAHCWVFTPSSLFDVLAGMARLDLLRFSFERFFPTEPYTNEFILVLTCIGAQEAIDGRRTRADEFDRIAAANRSSAAPAEASYRATVGSQDPDPNRLTVSRRDVAITGG
jgi:SAM-dependent methyltransferase